MKLWVLVVLLLLVACVTANAAVPPMISYQGKLMQPSGAIVPDGTYSMQFAIYDVPTGGTPLWSETNPSVQVRGGLFATMLGSVVNLPANIFDQPGRFFGVKVGDDPEMTPRQQIASVGFAYRAAVAGTVDDGAITAVKIADASIGSSKLSDGSVTGDKIASQAITTDKIATDAWAPWTPTIAAGGGDGSISNTWIRKAVYTKLGRTVHFRLVFFTTASGTITSVTATLPIPAADANWGSGCMIADSSVHAGYVYLKTTTTLSFSLYNTSSFLGETAVIASGTYESAD